MATMQTTQATQPSLSTTENGGTAYQSTGSSTMDLFVKGVRGCPVEYINEKLPGAWTEGAERACKLMCHSRDPRDGKGERDVSFAMLKWLHTHKPLTYALNIARIASQYGRYEDLLEMNNRTDSVVELQAIADQLRDDMESEHPSLAAKWSATEGGHYKKQQKKIARLLFPNDPAPDKRYRKECIVPLREKLHIIEVLMSAERWGEINFEHVPAQAMRIYGRDHVSVYGSNPKATGQGTFLRHCPEKFAEYRSAVKEGKATIKTTGIQPHQLVAPYVNRGQLDETVELQWTALIEKLRAVGSLGSSMAIIDVSSSMHGQPMEVAIALGLVVASLAAEPFKNKAITFHETPSIFTIPEGTLYDKVQATKGARWGGSTNFEASLDLVLTTAQLYGVLPENMVKTLFVFTDMQFDTAHRQQTSQKKPRYSHLLVASDDESDGEETPLSPEDILYNVCRKKYEAAGYQLPKIVFWNLRASEKDAFPVTVSNNGTAFVSGFSSDLLKVFLEGIDFEPLNILTQLLSKYEVQVHPDEL